MTMEYSKSCFNTFVSKLSDRKVIAAGLVISGVWIYYKTKSILRERQLWADIERRRTERNSFIDQLRIRLSTTDTRIIEKRSRILAMTFSELLDNLQAGNIKAKDALEAYQWKAMEADNALSCVCLFFPDANERADELDEAYKDVDKPPLFGIPVSIKESINVQGYDSTRGYATALFHPSTEDAVVVSVLRRLGAIPFVHTNIPQSLFSYGCSNMIYGTTRNPHDIIRTPGGSSGGEAALLAYGGSILGIGGDVGGSIRIPAHFCGIVGLKPSSTRLSQIGSLSSVPGRPKLYASIGPMGRDVDSVATVMRSLTCEDMIYEFDAYLKPSFWREEIYNGKDNPVLTIGYYCYDKFMEATPACRRAVEEAKAILERNGHTLVPFSYSQSQELVTLAGGASFMDGGEYMYRLASEDIIDPLYSSALRLYALPAILKRWLGFLLRPFSPILSTLLTMPPKSLADARSIYERIDIIRTQYVNEWKSQGLDAVICPAFACTALPHAVPNQLMPAATYTIVHNVLDFSAGVVPITTVNATDELSIIKGGYKRKEWFSKMIYNHCSKGTVGLPVAVQVLALPNEEETCLRVMKEIEQGRT